MFILVLMVAFICGTLSAEAHLLDDPVARDETVLIGSPYGHAVKLFEIAYGSGEGQLCRTDIMEDAEILVPKSFTIDKGGNFYVLDTLRDQIKIYTGEGVYLDAIDLPRESYGLDLEIIDEELFLYDDDTNLYRISPEDPTHPEVILSVSRPDIAGIYRSGGKLFIRSYNGMDKVITKEDDTIGFSDDSAGWNVKTDNTVIGLRKRGDVYPEGLAETVTYDLTCRLLPAGAHCLKKEEGILYTLSNESGKQYVETIISKIQNGTITGRALTISGRIYDYGTPFKKIYVDNDVVYQMVPEENAVAFYRIPWTEEYETRFSSAMIAEYNEMITRDTSGENTVSPQAANSFSVTREEAMQRAYTMCYTGWHYDPATMHTPTTTEKESPEHLGDTAKNVAGIPYCWGGMNGLDTATYTGRSAEHYQNFADCLTSGKTAGNIRCQGNFKSGTFGIDCSGFICAAFKINGKYGTGTLASQGFSELVNVQSVQAGDVAISAGVHTFMIEYVYKSTASGIYMFGTYESTKAGSSDCAKGYTRDYSDVGTTYKFYTY